MMVVLAGLFVAIVALQGSGGRHSAEANLYVYVAPCLQLLSMLFLISLFGGLSRWCLLPSLGIFFGSVAFGSYSGLLASLGASVVPPHRLLVAKLALILALIKISGYGFVLFATRTSACHYNAFSHDVNPHNRFAFG